MTAAATEPPPDAVLPVRSPAAPRPGERVPAHYRECFGCGPDSATGLRLEVTAAEGVAVTARFTVAEHHQGAPGLAHGGLLAAAFDEAQGFLLWLMRQPAVTGHLETSFLQPVPVGTTLHISAWCRGVAGRRIFTAGEGRLDSPGGAVAVRSSAVFVTVSLEHFARHGRPLTAEQWAGDAASYNP